MGRSGGERVWAVAVARVPVAWGWGGMGGGSQGQLPWFKKYSVMGVASQGGSWL